MTKKPELSEYGEKFMKDEIERRTVTTDQAIEDVVAKMKERQEHACHHCNGTGHNVGRMAGGGCYSGPCEWCRGSGRNDL